MKKTFSILSLILIFGMAACGSTTLPATPGPAPVSEASPLPEPGQPLPESPVPAAETAIQPSLSAPSGLRVVYLREGNLWSWTQMGGNTQLTGTGDMSTARLSDDGQLLAFMRGRDIWTVRMDGTDARLLAAQAAGSSALWFAPNGSLLAVSTSDHIDVIDINAPSLNTVVTYPAVPDGYYPEVVWSPDSSGFKTVIPSQGGQAELLFVFPNGTVASLAKFTLLPLSESLSYISPDGGYVIYVAKSGDGKESLYLMDSSGATKPYGEEAANVRVLGWLPDAKHFAYAFEDAPRAFLGDVAGNPQEISLAGYQVVRWVDEEQFLGLQGGSLYLGDIHSRKILIDAQVSTFDFGQ